jgi:membrane associated rhomboid family serine protease
MSAVLGLILANVAVLLVRTIQWNSSGVDTLHEFGGLHWGLTVHGLQFWRLLTYQYLHTGAFHILLNMVMLWFIGPMVERPLGGRAFLAIYTASGLAAGLLFLLVAPMVRTSAELVGASGSVLGITAAAAMLSPNLVVSVFFVASMRMRTFAGVLAGLYLVMALLGHLSDVAHLGGMIGGAGAIMVLARRRSSAERSPRRAEGAWNRRQENLQRERDRVDHILEKIHAKGIRSLTWFERRTLRKATERQRRQEREIDRG